MSRAPFTYCRVIAILLIAGGLAWSVTLVTPPSAPQSAGNDARRAVAVNGILAAPLVSPLLTTLLSRLRE